jgi:hypothetical protein
MTRANVLISDEFPEALGFDHSTGRILISADKLVASLTAHFSALAAELRDPQNASFRRNFELRFDFDNND